MHTHPPHNLKSSIRLGEGVPVKMWPDAQDPYHSASITSRDTSVSAALSIAAYAASFCDPGLSMIWKVWNADSVSLAVTEAVYCRLRRFTNEPCLGRLLQTAASRPKRCYHYCSPS